MAGIRKRKKTKHSKTSTPRIFEGPSLLPSKTGIHHPTHKTRAHTAMTTRTSTAK